MGDLWRVDGRRWRARHDGWNAERQTAFLIALSRTGCVRDACRSVGISSTSAYRLRRECPDFAAGWDRALKRAMPTLEGAAFTRAVEGWEEPVYQGGRMIGTRRRYSDSLLRLLLQRGMVDDGAAPPAPAVPEWRPPTMDAYDMTEEEAKAEVIRRLDMIVEGTERKKARKAAERARLGYDPDTGGELGYDPDTGGDEFYERDWRPGRQD